MADAGAFLDLGTATLGESGARPLAPRLRPGWPGAAVAGPAFTARCPPGDNLAVHVAVAEAPAGAVLVVHVEGEVERGWWGEVLTTAAQARSLIGLVIDACIRDTDGIARHRFPVFATGVALAGTAKAGGGDVGLPVTVGDVSVEPGDWMVGDADGVVCIPARSLSAVVTAARQRDTDEAAYFEALRAGRTTIELFALDASRVDRPSARPPAEG